MSLSRFLTLSEEQKKGGKYQRVEKKFSFHVSIEPRVAGRRSGACTSGGRRSGRLLSDRVDEIHVV